MYAVPVICVYRCKNDRKSVVAAQFCELQLKPVGTKVPSVVLGWVLTSCQKVKFG